MLFGQRIIFSQILTQSMSTYDILLMVYLIMYFNKSLKQKPFFNAWTTLGLQKEF